MKGKRYFRVEGKDTTGSFVIAIHSDDLFECGDRRDNNPSILSEAVSQGILEYEEARYCSFYINETDGISYTQEQRGIHTLGGTFNEQ